MMTRYIIRLASGLYYRRGPVPHWTEDVGQATVFEFKTVAEVEAGLHLDGYAYDVVPIQL